LQTFLSYARGWRLNDVQEVWISKASHANDPDELIYRFEGAGDRLESLGGTAPLDRRPLVLVKSFAAR